MPQVNPVISFSSEVPAYIPGNSRPAGMLAEASAGVVWGQADEALSKHFSAPDHPIHLKRDEESVAGSSAGA